MVIIFFLLLPLKNEKQDLMPQKHGEVAEWFKAHAWKVCVRQKRIGGSNPFLSAFLQTSKNNFIVKKQSMN